MLDADLKKELVILLRGFFMTPIMSGLGRKGVLDRMFSSDVFSTSDFSEVVANVELLEKTFHYLTDLGFLAPGESAGRYRLTELGRQVFQRCSSFYVPHSYHKYMEAYYELLGKGDVVKPSVDRLENVIGSGETHLRYFPPALSFLRRKIQCEALIDVGCGNGFFLDAALRDLPKIDAVGVDISSVSIETTKKNLQKNHPDRILHTICADATNIEEWGQQALSFAVGKRAAITMWFLLHEVSHNSVDFIIDYLRVLGRKFPGTPLLVCELVRHDSQQLSSCRDISIMPEYLFFHEMSEQGILSWGDYAKVSANIPYTVAVEKLFDELPDKQGRFIPSVFLWCLLSN